MTSEKIIPLVNSAKRNVISAVNLTMVCTYFMIGKIIVENEQNRGEDFLKTLASKLTDKYGKGFSKRNLELMRKFYLSYHDKLKLIDNNLKDQYDEIALKVSVQFKLSWSHYVFLRHH